MKLFSSAATLVGSIWILLALISGANEGLFVTRDGTFGLNASVLRRSAERVVSPLVREAENLSRPRSGREVK